MAAHDSAHKSPATPARLRGPRYRVAVRNEQSTLAVQRRQIAAAVRAVLAGEGVPAAEISIAIVDDETIHAINREFLAHDYATDVISFTLSDAGGPLEGEIVASADTALANARRLGVDPARELLLYVVHGTLHLAGHDDKQTAARALMRRLERKYLAQMDAAVSADRRPAADRPRSKKPVRPKRRTGVSGATAP